VSLVFTTMTPEISGTRTVMAFLGIDVALKKLKAVHEGQFLPNDLLILLIEFSEHSFDDGILIRLLMRFRVIIVFIVGTLRIVHGPFRNG